MQEFKCSPHRLWLLIGGANKLLSTKRLKIRSCVPTCTVDVFWNHVGRCKKRQKENNKPISFLRKCQQCLRWFATNNSWDYCTYCEPMESPWDDSVSSEVTLACSRGDHCKPKRSHKNQFPAPQSHKNRRRSASNKTSEQDVPTTSLALEIDAWNGMAVAWC